MLSAYLSSTGRARRPLSPALNAPGERRRESMRRFYDDEYAQARPEVTCLPSASKFQCPTTAHSGNTAGARQLRNHRNLSRSDTSGISASLRIENASVCKASPARIAFASPNFAGRSANRDADRHHPSPVNHHELMSKRGYTLRRQRVRPVCLC